MRPRRLGHEPIDITLEIHSDPRRWRNMDSAALASCFSSTPVLRQGLREWQVGGLVRSLPETPSGVVGGLPSNSTSTIKARVRLLLLGGDP